MNIPDFSAHSCHLWAAGRELVGRSGRRDGRNDTACAIRVGGKSARIAMPKHDFKRVELRFVARGMLPTWMREEMKGTKLTKDSFLIK